jgi:heme exporter protein B
LGIGPETQLLRSIAPGVVWVAALLASMLSLGRLFANDYQDGTLEQLLLTPQPLYLVVFGKVLAHWIIAELPLVLIAPLVGVQFDLGRETLSVLFVSLLVGTPVLSLIGSVGAALTLGLRGGGVLISILILPLYIPALIFGAGAVEASILGVSSAPHLYLLGAFAIVSLLFAPWAASAALRISLE